MLDNEADPAGTLPSHLSRLHCRRDRPTRHDYADTKGQVVEAIMARALADDCGEVRLEVRGWKSLDSVAQRGADCRMVKVAMRLL